MQKPPKYKIIVLYHIT